MNWWYLVCAIWGGALATTLCVWSFVHYQARYLTTLHERISRLESARETGQNPSLSAEALDRIHAAVLAEIAVQMTDEDEDDETPKVIH